MPHTGGTDGVSVYSWAVCVDGGAGRGGGGPGLGGRLGLGGWTAFGTTMQELKIKYFKFKFSF